MLGFGYSVPLQRILDFQGHQFMPYNINISTNTSNIDYKYLITLTRLSSVVLKKFISLAGWRTSHNEIPDSQPTARKFPLGDQERLLDAKSGSNERMDPVWRRS
jgi:hypothetical protein